MFVIYTVSVGLIGSYSSLVEGGIETLSEWLDSF